jgi:hypothetical protein
MPLKGAQEFLEDLVRDVSPPRGIAIVLREDKPQSLGGANWIAATGILPLQALSRYDSAIAELRRQYPVLDWEGITERDGEWRRIARYLSEVEK